MNRADWLAWRREGLGASDIAGVLGVSPWASPWSIWASKVGLADDDHDTESMEFGRYAEGMIAPWFHDRTGLFLAGEQTWCSHPEHPWRRCTVDGFIMESATAPLTEAVAVAEVKTTSDAAAKWEADGIPAHYEAQSAWQAHVTGIPAVTFLVVHLAYGRPQFRIYETHPTADDIAVCVEAAERFWHEHVVTGNPPPVDAHRATRRALDHAWADPAAEPPVDVSDIAELVREWDAAKRHAKTEDLRADALANQIKARLADRTEGVIGDDLAVSWREQERTGIDAKAVRAAYGDKFDTRSTYRVLRSHLPSTTHKTKEHTTS